MTNAVTAVIPSYPEYCTLKLMPETTWYDTCCGQQLSICGCRLAKRASPRSRRVSLGFPNLLYPWNPPGSADWVWLAELMTLIQSPDNIYRLESLARHELAAVLLLPVTVITRGLMLMNSPGESWERVVMTETLVQLDQRVKQTSCRPNGFLPRRISRMVTLKQGPNQGQVIRRYSIAFSSTQLASELFQQREERVQGVLGAICGQMATTRQTSRRAVRGIQLIIAQLQGACEGRRPFQIKKPTPQVQGSNFVDRMRYVLPIFDWSFKMEG